jgi:hypothetical protein
MRLLHSTSRVVCMVMVYVWLGAFVIAGTSFVRSTPQERSAVCTLRSDSQQGRMRNQFAEVLDTVHKLTGPLRPKRAMKP